MTRRAKCECNNYMVRIVVLSRYSIGYFCLKCNSYFFDKEYSKGKLLDCIHIGLTKIEGGKKKKCVKKEIY